MNLVRFRATLMENFCPSGKQNVLYINNMLKRMDKIDKRTTIINFLFCCKSIYTFSYLHVLISYFYLTSLISYAYGNVVLSYIVFLLYENIKKYMFDGLDKHNLYIGIEQRIILSKKGKIFHHTGTIWHDRCSNVTWQ